MADQVIIITGAGNGIGLAIVRKLLLSSKVSHVVAVDLNDQKLKPIQMEHPKRLHIVIGDVSEAITNTRAVEAAIRHAGKLTTLILNAATFKPIGAFPMLTLESWKKTFDINFFSVVHMLQVAWPHLHESGGTVLVTSTRLSLQPCESWTCYGCTKSLVNYLCGCIPLENSRIRCVAITPGAVDTDMQTEMREQGELSLATQKFLNALKDEGKLLKPEEPAAAFVKLVEAGVPDTWNGKTVNWDVIMNGTKSI